MIKRLLLTAAMGFTLGTAAFAQTTAEPAKTDAGAPSATQATIAPGSAPNVIGPERNRIAKSIEQQNVRALKGVDFSVAVGSSVPRELRVYPIPADVVQIVPQYRNYRFLVVEKDIAILDPATRKIVTVLPREATETATAAAAPTVTPMAPAASTTRAAVTPAPVTPVPAAQAQAPQPVTTPSATAQAAPTPPVPTQAASSQPAEQPVAQVTPAPSSATPSAAASSASAQVTPTAAAPPAQQSAEQTPAPANEQAQAAPAKKQASVERAKRRAARAEARRAYGEVRVGQRIPDNVRLYDLPPDLRAEVPQSTYRSAQPRPRSYVAGSRSRIYYEYD